MAVWDCNINVSSCGPEGTPDERGKGGVGGVGVEGHLKMPDVVSLITIHSKSSSDVCIPDNDVPCRLSPV